MSEIKVEEHTNDGAKDTNEVPDEWANMSMKEEAVVERALVSIARYIHDKRARVVDVFRSMDHDGGGTIDREELEWGLQKFGCQLEDDELDMVVSVFDSDGGGTIDFKEFAAAIKFAHRLLVKELAKQEENQRKAKQAKLNLKLAKKKAVKKQTKERHAKERRNVRFKIADRKAHEKKVMGKMITKIACLKKL